MTKHYASPEREFRVLDKLFKGLSMKQVAFEEQIHYNTVSYIKRTYPLFFWRETKEDE